jgi:hypothetical protein
LVIIALEKFMRKLLARLNIAILLLAVYLPFLSPSANAAPTTPTRFGTELANPSNGSDGCYADLLMLGAVTGGQPVNSQGYPSTINTNAQFCVYFQGYPSGNYQLYAEGKMSGLYMPGCPFQSMQTTTVNGKTITIAIVPLNPPAWQPVTYANSAGGQLSDILIDYTPTDATDLPTNFHLMRPDVPAWYDGWADNNSIFGKDFLQAISPFCAIRFVNWMWFPSALPAGATSTGVTTWASRPSPTNFGSRRAICYENMIELCNETNKDMWINIPYYAVGPTATDWCYNMATLIKATLKPGLHCYYEISDELWNDGPYYWWGWDQVEVWGKANPDLNFIAPVWQKHGGEMGVLLMNAEQIMQPILGAQGRPILAGQFVLTDYCSGGLQYIAKQFGPPANYIWAIAGAPYFGLNSVDPPSTPVLTNLLDTIALEQPCFTANIALANQYGVKFCCYESGQSLNAGYSPTLFAQYEAAQSDPGMATCYLASAKDIEAAGTELSMWFAFCMQDGAYGFWGALNDIRQIHSNPPSVKYAAEVNITTASCQCSNPSSIASSAAASAAAAKAAAVTPTPAPAPKSTPATAAAKAAAARAAAARAAAARAAAARAAAARAAAARAAAARAAAARAAAARAAAARAAAERAAAERAAAERAAAERADASHH